MKYELPKELKDTIVSYLESVVVPSTVGFNLITIVKALSTLNEIKEIKEEVKSDK